MMTLWNFLHVFLHTLCITQQMYKTGRDDGKFQLTLHNFNASSFPAKASVLAFTFVKTIQSDLSELYICFFGESFIGTHVNLLYYTDYPVSTLTLHVVMLSLP